MQRRHSTCPTNLPTFVNVTAGTEETESVKDVCWRAGKGYYQDGDHMVCRNCGRRFASVLVNEVKGGCNPAPLNRALENGKLIIQIKDILDGQQYFNFAGKA